ncbi:MAG: hypothetical protein ACI4XJ_05970 [Eubacteriales bacterium]
MNENRHLCANLCAHLCAIDALGRQIPSPDAPKEVRENKYVGLFYFLWLGEHGRHKPYDISKITHDDPDAGHKPDSEVWGGIGTYHHWGEPFYGYYYSDDEWVVRRHMRLLCESGVDFLFFDTTNAIMYEKNVKLVMSVLDEYAHFGLDIPKVMFYTNTASGKTVEEIYQKIYKANFCPDTWFRYEGKPVIIAVKEECSPEAREFFNIKMSQWPNEPDKDGGWPWMDFVRPQRAFNNLDGIPECINVSVAQHPQLRFGDSVLYGENGNRGRSYHGNGEAKSSSEFTREDFLSGRNLAEQFERAIEADVPVTLVTGWNEWIAGRWQGIPERPIMFVDCANYEYSRDIEMMRGGYFDNYYMQLCDYTARLKGRAEIPVHGTGERAEYLGFPDGDFSREHEGYDKVYVNRTQRSAIEKITVSHTRDELCFEIETKSPVDTTDTCGSFFNIFISTADTAGYNFVLNLTCADGCTSLAKTDESFDVKSEEKLGENTAVISGRRIKITCPLDKLGVGDEFAIRFKVCDSREEIKSFEDFYDKGDCIPTGRLDFIYKGKRTQD